MSGSDPKNEDVFDHTGHRARMRAYYLEHGMDVMRDYEILEMMLYYTIPRGDTRTIARRLIVQFESLSAVLDAPYEALIAVKGVGERTATFLKQIPDFSRAYLTDRNRRDDVLDSQDKIEAYLEPCFIGRNVECFYVLCLDSACRARNCVKLNEGESHAVTVNTQKIGALLSAQNVSMIVIAHNHPFGPAMPSSADIELTKQIRLLARSMNVRMLDHIIFAEDGNYSMRQSEKWRRLFDA